MAQVNDNNHLIWTDDVVVPGLPDVPWQYHRYRNTLGSPPVAVAGEAIGFYVNNLTGYFDQDIDNADLTLDVQNAQTGAIVSTDIEDIEKHVVSGDPAGNHRWNPWAIAVWPTLPFGVYRLQIRIGGNVLLTSSYLVCLVDADFVKEHTVFCRFKHDRYFYGIKYHEISGFYQQFRLVMGKVDMQPKSEKQVYKEAHTGKSRTYNAFLDKVYKLETYYMNDQQHTATMIMSEMDFLEMNGRRYRLETAYKVVTDPNNEATKGEFEVTEEAFSSANRC